MSTSVKCKKCNGSGHDKGGRPVIKLEQYTKEDGTTARRHVTIKQGSGCTDCLGLGVLFVDTVEVQDNA